MALHLVAHHAIKLGLHVVKAHHAHKAHSTALHAVRTAVKVHAVKVRVK
jgi:hypothetical protein